MAEKERYSVVFSNRKTVGIGISKDGRLTVRAPYGTSRLTIERILREKEDWIRKSMERVMEEARQNNAPSDRYFDGALFPLHGGAAELMLREVPDADSIIVSLRPDVRGTLLSVRGSNLTPERVQEAIDVWGRKYAKAYLEARVRQYAEKLDVEIGRITIRETKTRWGSCTADGNLNFHWKLILLPKSICDYVIVHELCHRFEMNHSKAFWANVAAVFPDYKDRRKKLKEIEKRILSW